MKKPRLRDRGGAEDEEPIRFTSKILPPYLRRSKALDELIPALYLRGISTGDMQGALSALLGAEAARSQGPGVEDPAETGRGFLSAFATQSPAGQWTARLASGQRSAKYQAPRASSDAGSTRTTNVLNKLPKSLQAKAKSDLKDIWMAETRVDAEAAFDLFIEKYGVKYDKVAQCLAKDRDALLAFYDFPAEHWKHLRTANPSRHSGPSSA